MDRSSSMVSRSVSSSSGAVFSSFLGSAGVVLTVVTRSLCSSRKRRIGLRPLLLAIDLPLSMRLLPVNTGWSSSSLSEAKLILSISIRGVWSSSPRFGYLGSWFTPLTPLLLSPAAVPNVRPDGPLSLLILLPPNPDADPEGPLLLPPPLPLPPPPLDRADGSSSPERRDLSM